MQDNYVTLHRQKMAVEDILRVFEGYRMSPTIDDQYEEVGKEKLEQKIEPFVAMQKPIDFVMLGFPFKSTNHRDKTLGQLPDKAEEATLNNFEAFNNAVKIVYAPGVNIHIVSDGLIFNDLLGVRDSIVHTYKEISTDMGQNAPMHWYDLNDFYPGLLSTGREKLLQHFGISEDQLEKDILFNKDVNYLYRGMMHFMEEELKVRGFPSRNQLNKAAKILTRQMMFRNEAYSALVRKEFSNMVRLSMHPSVNNGAKYSFKLIPGNNTRHSAWHCVLVVNGQEFMTMHKIDAENAGYELVYKDGKPDYFIAKAETI